MRGFNQYMAYTDQQINDFLTLAQEVGITRAKRELGYPNSWATAKRWADLRQVNISVDEVMARAKASDEWYKDEEVLVLAQEGFNRIYEEVTTNPNLTPDEQKKLSEAASKWFGIYASIKGKATNITENRTADPFDVQIQELMNIERAKNMTKKELTSPSVA